MKWTHLPAPGGLFDQDPMLLRHWNIVWATEAEVRADEDKKRDKKSGKKKRKRGGGPASPL
jgi:hypothetical protein